MHFTLASAAPNAVDPNATLPPGNREALAAHPARHRPSLRRLRELLQELARGAAKGVVFCGPQISIDRFVALKMILAGRLSFSEAPGAAAFHAEAKAGNLDHPNIVPIYEVNRHEGRVYYSMKFIEGCSLAQVLKDFNSPTERDSKKILAAHQADSARIMAATARAVHHAHYAASCTGDLKPANILLRIQPMVERERGAGSRLHFDATRTP